ncbi:CusA/CzcA family heavy metal efflux RND transporter [soil metagenome]
MLQRLLQFSLHQRLLVIAAAILVAILGGISWNSLTLDAVPDITTNQVQINTDSRGMGPEEAEKLVTFPIESAMGGVPGVVEVRSLSQYGLSQVTVTFRDDVDIYFARQLVNERLGRIREELPAGIDAPQLAPVSTGLGEIYMYSLESDKRSPTDLRTIQDWQIAPQLRSVPGVAEVSAADGSEKQFQVEIDPLLLKARSLGITEVISALQRNNQNAGGGVIEHNGQRTIVRGVGLAKNIEDIKTMEITHEGGTPVLIGDVAEVKIGAPVLTGISTKDGREAMVATVLMLKGANGREVANAVDEKVKEIRGQLASDLKLTTTYDRSVLVNETVHTVQKSLLEGGILVILVLLILLGDFRGAIIVASVIPLSMLVAIIGMNRFGISGNLMSLGAIDFGLIVDGAVVMIENAVRRLAEAREHKGQKLTREEVRQTVWQASLEVAKPTAFAVSIIAVAYLPILSLEGTEGKMFRPMAFTVVFALLGALVLTLTLVPALASLVLSGDTREGKSPVMAFFDRIYRPVLDLALRQRAVIVVGATCLLVASGFIFTRLGSEFIPTLDEGSIVIQPVRLRTVDAEQTVALVTAMEKKLLEIPEVTTVFSRSGTPEIATDPMPLSLSDSFIMLKPQSQWRPGLDKEKLLAELEDKANEVPGQGYGFTQPIEMRFSELISGVKADIGIKVFGEDLDVLLKKADEIAGAIRSVQGAADVSVEQVDDIPVVEIEVDRAAAARLGVSVVDIQQLVGTAMGGETVGQIVESDRRFNMVVRLPENVRDDLAAIRDLPIVTADGSSVTLADVTHIEEKPAPAQISREGGKRRVVVQVNVRGSDLGTFVNSAKRVIAAKVKLPEGYYLTWGGQFENLQRASTRLTLAVPAALVLIFGLLFAMFNSVRQAVLIFTGVPLAVTGGIFALALRGLPFSISAGVGFIALSGVAVLNGVVLVSAINRLRSDGMTVTDAARSGAKQRLRPVLMTALVAALGFVPMALNSGIGSEVQRPLATVVIGGIVSATLLTLVALPVLYAWIEKQSPKETAVARTDP